MSWYYKNKNKLKVDNAVLAQSMEELAAELVIVHVNAGPKFISTKNINSYKLQ